MATEVIYARVPTELKEAADAYAVQTAKTLTGAVVDLLERGLAAVSDERSIEGLRESLSRVTVEKAAAEAELVTARAQLATLATFAERASQPVGSCPNCGKQITSRDLFATSRCPHCKTTLADLIAPKSSGPLDQREVLLFVGALGAVLAVAYLSTKK